MKVGFIGAGRMGRPMVASLVDAGRHVFHRGSRKIRRQRRGRRARIAGELGSDLGALDDVIKAVNLADKV